MGAPDVYLRSKVPQDMFHILQQFAEIRKLTRLSLIRDFNLFPDTEKLLTLERKYGDSLNFEDLNGYPGKPKKKKHVDDGSTVVSVTATATATVNVDQNKTQTGTIMSDPLATQQSMPTGTLTDALGKT